MPIVALSLGASARWVEDEADDYVADRAAVARGLRALQRVRSVTDGRRAEPRHLLEADVDTCLPLPGVAAEGGVSA
ncbi:hypothetical protein [Streptomyces noursei]